MPSSVTQAPGLGDHGRGAAGPALSRPRRADPDVAEGYEVTARAAAETATWPRRN
jgi:hypothetical protein